ncbi:Hypothetical protein AAM4_1442 [Actinomyces succiniciruminis]|uniref:Uncharacterized protein n=1 Tax=Actinomyces succiniciruminis TaxID=1522002 RepID=A0A1L7RPK5_9ACTO|nr:Hypothetical protein AAM4_1442 [Actinomyces succiniciruminis]
MSPRPRRRSLAEREAEAIQGATSTTSRTTTRRKPTPPRRKAAAQASTNTTNTTDTTAVSARSVTIWVDTATWGRAQTVYLRSTATTGQQLAWKEWIAQTVSAYLNQDDGTGHQQRDTASASGQRSVWLPGTVIEQLDHAVAARAMAGQAATRSSLIVEALAHAVDAAGGADVPIFTGRLPRGPRPRPRT